jgi:hypothetical protein
MNKFTEDLQIVSIFFFGKPRAPVKTWTHLLALRLIDSSGLYIAVTQLGPTYFYKAPRTHIYLSATFSSNHSIQQVQSSFLPVILWGED